MKNINEILNILKDKIATTPSRVTHMNYTPNRYTNDYCLCTNIQELLHDGVVNEYEYNLVISLIKSNTPNDKTKGTHWYKHSELDKRVNWINEQLLL